MNSAHVVTFKIGVYVFGLLSSQVIEVLEPTLITPVARAPDYLAGIITVRGLIVTAVDLAQILHIERSGLATAPRNHLITKIDDEWISLLADSIGDIVEINLPESSPSSFDIDQTWTQVVTHLIPDGSQMIYLLNIRDYLLTSTSAAA